MTVSRTSRLDQEGQNISADEYLSQPSSLNRSQVLPFCESDQATEDHIDTCCEKGRAEEKEEGLEDEDVETGFVAVGKSASHVSDPFDYSCQLRLGKWRGIYTEASNDEGNKVVGPASRSLENVRRSCGEETDNEDDCCN
jgi:hypothetical protein